MKPSRPPRSSWIGAVVVLLAAVAAPAALAAQQDPYVLQGLVVTASPTPRPLDALAAHVTVLEGSKLRAEGLTRVQQALRQVPGLAVVQSGSTGATTSLFLRGGESDYVLVMVDGVPINQPGGAVDLSSLTLDNVQRIEVVEGPASSLYGSDAVAGVIQIITKTGQGPTRLRVGAGVGTYGRRRWSAAVSGGSAGGSYSLDLSHLSTNGILPFNNGYANTTLSAGAQFHPDRTTSARLDLRLVNHTYHFPTDAAGNVVDHNQYTHGSDVLAGAGVTRFVGRAFELQGQVGLDQTTGGTDNPPDGPADTLGYFASYDLDHVQTASVDVRASYHFAAAVATLGWEVEQESERLFTESQSQWGASSDRSRYARWNRAYYAYLTGGRGPATFTLGGRLEDNERFGKLGTWQAGVTWKPAGPAGPRLRASAGLGIKEPTFYENYATGFARGNPNLSPERSRSWETGLDQGFAAGRATVKVSYFSQVFTDLIEYTATAPSPEAPNYFNVGSASASGVELEGRAELGRLGLHGSWTWLRTRVLDGGPDQGPGSEFLTGRRLLRRPTNSVVLGATYAVGRRASLTTGLDVVGSRADLSFKTDPAERVLLPRYENLWAGGDVRLWASRGDRPGATLTVRGENLLGQSYQEVYGFPAPGRTLVVGGEVTFGGGR